MTETKFPTKFTNEEAELIKSDMPEEIVDMTILSACISGAEVNEFVDALNFVWGSQILTEKSKVEVMNGLARARVKLAETVD